MSHLRHQHDSEKEFIASTSRVEAFSDAVIAIIMTLLVLELKVPHLETASIRDSLLSLRDLVPHFVAFGLSFLALAIVWVNHHHFFHGLKGIDQHLLWYNNHLLFWVCLAPFVTAFAGENSGNALAMSLYGVVMGMMSIAFLLMIRYAFFRSNIVPESVSMRTRQFQYIRAFFGPIAYTIAAVCAFAIPWVSVVLYVLVMAFYFLPRRIEDTMMSMAVGDEG